MIKKPIDVRAARVHNLKNVSVKIPREKLVVLTGLSGSGKSSLAFDTIYAEGQRRYIETFSAYARQFIGNLERPDVEKIDGLSPVIAIEQKTTSKNPRSTVGTITELYDYIRLLYARIGTAYSYISNKKMISYTDEQINNLIEDQYNGKNIIIMAPIIKSRKGHYRELFQTLSKQGYIKVRINNKITSLKPGLELDRYKTHSIELIIDQIQVIKNQKKSRLFESIKTGLEMGNNSLLILELENNENRYFSKNLICFESGISYDKPEPNTFSFNSPKGMCQKCKGLGVLFEINRQKIIPDVNKSISGGGIIPLGDKKNNWIYKQIESISKRYNFSLSTMIKDISKEALEIILKGGQEKFSITTKSLGVKREYKIDFEGIENFIKSQYNNTESKNIRRWASSFMDENICGECEGSRLKKEARYFKIDKKNIIEISKMDLKDLYKWFSRLNQGLSDKELIISREIINEVIRRLNFLLNVGLDYLKLSRPTKSLSGGESQRIRLATQVGSQLTGVLYIMDEPTIGLHQKDNEKLIDSLKSLRNIGNSVIVVEHDKEMMLKSDHIVDLGPFAGKNGGQIVSQGTPNFIKKQNSLTGKYLGNIKKIDLPKKRRSGNGKRFIIEGCSGNNLKKINVEFPLGLLIGVTGVSGSGKSSLVNQTVYPVLSSHLYKSLKKPLPFEKIKGLEHIDKVVNVNQSPIGRTPRSNPATYCGFFNEIRSLFSLTTESKKRGYNPGRFSFNVKGGRCENCKGGGTKVIEMNFLPDVHIECEECHGKRFNRETIEIRYKGKSIHDVLKMTVNEACIFFNAIPNLSRKLSTIKKVGLGYLTLGQSSTTLSGGEAQRIKLASELSKKDTGKTFYILDEPTTGLHFEDIKVLIGVLDKLVDKGNTVLVIEHNLDVIKQMDYIIDIGPNGGKDGGKIIGYGTPEHLSKIKSSHTAKYLFKELKSA